MLYLQSTVPALLKRYRAIMHNEKGHTCALGHYGTLSCQATFGLAVLWIRKYFLSKPGRYQP